MNHRSLLKQISARVVGHAVAAVYDRRKVGQASRLSIDNHGTGKMPVLLSVRGQRSAPQSVLEDFARFCSAVMKVKIPAMKNIQSFARTALLLIVAATATSASAAMCKYY